MGGRESQARDDAGGGGRNRKPLGGKNLRLVYICPLNRKPLSRNDLRNPCAGPGPSGADRHPVTSRRDNSLSAQTRPWSGRDDRVAHPLADRPFEGVESGLGRPDLLVGFGPSEPPRQ